MYENIQNKNNILRFPNGIQPVRNNKTTKENVGSTYFQGNDFGDFMFVK